MTSRSMQQLIPERRRVIGPESWTMAGHCGGGSRNGCAAVLLDLAIPTLVLLALAVVSLIARRQRNWLTRIATASASGSHGGSGNRIDPAVDGTHPRGHHARRGACHRPAPRRQPVPAVDLMDARWSRRGVCLPGICADSDARRTAGWQRPAPAMARFWRRRRS
jgi:hypothetical protein